MKLEVLLSTMHQKDFAVADSSNIESDCIIINQCDEESFKSENRDGHIIRMFSTKERGLSRSRNMALKEALADICLLADDDEVFTEDYANTIIDAFKKVPQADILIFNIIEKNHKVKTETMIKSIKKVPKHRFYGSVRIAFKRHKIINSNLYFDTNFGTGSGLYSMGEDSLFLRAAHKKGLKIYAYPATIASVDFSTSTWFKGYDKKYFYDIGAFLSAAFPNLKKILSFYYVFKLKNRTDLSSSQMLRAMKMGMKGYKNKIKYDDYKKQ